jgi:hypothetical protein
MDIGMHGATLKIIIKTHKFGKIADTKLKLTSF